MDQKQQEERISDSEILLNLRFVKTILMLLVILGHSVKFWEGNWFTKNPQLVSESLAWLSRWIASFHIYAFTLVSGYIFTWKVRGGGTTGICRSYAIKQNDC